MTISLSLILLYKCLTAVSSYKCLLCDDIPLPNLCQEIGECGPHELCAVQRFKTASGIYRYHQSCMDKRKCDVLPLPIGTKSYTSTCAECCHGDLCNSGGCGAKGFDATLGPQCYACNLQIGTGGCSKIQQCGRDQECSINPVHRLGGPDDLFETKCTEKSVCDTVDRNVPSMIVGRKRSTCSLCCNSTLCNNFDNRACANYITPSSLHSVVSTNVPVTTLTTTSSSAVTESTTTEACEDLVKCFKAVCAISSPDYVAKNCRQTCGLCGTTKSTTLTPVTNQYHAASTGIATSLQQNLLCQDLAEGCNTFVHFCTLDAYKSWSKINCRRTCKYC